MSHVFWKMSEFMNFLANFLGWANEGFSLFADNCWWRSCHWSRYDSGVFFSQQAYYCYILPNLELHSIVSFGSVFIVSKKFI